MKVKKIMRFVSLLIVICMLLPFAHVVSAEENVNFDDVLSYYPYNSWAVDTGAKYTIIFLENNNRPCTRYEIASIMYNLLDLSKQKVKTASFTDIEDLDISKQEKILKVAEKNIIVGYEDGTFKPSNNVTRAEFIAMLDRTGILSSVKGNTKTNFDDIDKHWAKESILKIASVGILSGKEQNKFCPEDSITPQEILLILDRLVNKKCINEQQLISGLLDTFKCKQYSEKEKYIVEGMYFKFDELQNEANLSWPFKLRYDTTKWYEHATYQDLLNVMFYTVNYTSNINNMDINGETIYNNMKKYMLEIQGLENNQENLTKTITMRNLIKMIFAVEDMESIFNHVWEEEHSKINTDMISKLKFSNTNSLTPTEQNCLAMAAVYIYNGISIFENTNDYFPIDAPVTNYMLNIVMLNMSKMHNSNLAALTSIHKFLDIEKIQYETDLSKLPNNYYEYPYILKGIPKEVYEKKINGYDYDGHYHGPIECYEKYVPYTLRLIGKIKSYFDIILNVDYRDFDKNEFISKIDDFPYMVESEAEKYAQWVIDNKIILKGKGCAIPGTIALVEPFAQIRVIMDFEVLSADKMENLLYGDFSNMEGTENVPVQYTKRDYYLYYDMVIAGLLNYSGYIGSYEPNFTVVKMSNVDEL